MCTVGPFEMTFPEESFWEIVKYFDFLITDYGYKTRAMRIYRDYVFVSFVNPKTHKSIEIEEYQKGDGTIVSFKMYDLLGRCIIKDESIMSVKAYADYINNKYFTKNHSTKQCYLLAIPELKTKDEIFWSLYKSLYFLLRNDYSISRFEIGDIIYLEYRLRHNTIIVSTTKPYCINWKIYTKKWGIITKTQTISQYTEPKDIAKYITGAPILYEMYEASLVFSDTKLGKNKDPHLYYKTLYTCPNCGYGISFKEEDFHRYSLNRTSIFKDAFQGFNDNKHNSFLEFECPQCKKKTRVIFDIVYGDKEPIVKIDSVLVE